MARPRCPVCRSKRWHRDKASGLVVCEEGHVLQGYVQEDNEADPTSANVKRKRYVRKNKQRKERETANPDFFHGPRLRFLYFQCAQLILRHQIRALILHWQLPPELETIARDLWTMYVSLTDLEAVPFQHLEQQAADQSDQQQQAGQANPLPEEDPLQKYYDEMSDSDDEFPAEPEFTVEAEQSEDDAEEEEDNPQEDEDVKLKDKDQRRRDRPPRKIGEPFNPARKLKLQYTLVVCYLSCLTLRVPILMKDLLDLASSYKISYLEPLKSIPADMRKHLDRFHTESDFIQAHVLPVIGARGGAVTQSFVHLVVAFSRMLYVKYGITFPDINAAPVLWKCIKTLSLPPWLYITCRRILIRIDASMSFPYMKENRAKAQGLIVQDYPDALLAASIVISCKLLWGLDGRSRIPTDAEDIASTLPRLEAWLSTAERLLKQFQPTLVTKGARVDDVKDLTADEMDDFMDIFESNLLAQDGRGVGALGSLKLPTTLGSIADRFFPLPPRDIPPLQTASSYTAAQSAEFQEALRSFYSEVHPPLPGEAADDDPLFPGQQYKLYKFVGDHEGVVDRDLARVLALVSQGTGLNVREIENTVRRMEIKLATVVAGRRAQDVVSGDANHLPWEGYESRQFGQTRARGGQIGRPSNLADTYKGKKDTKQPAVLEPKVLPRK